MHWTVKLDGGPRRVNHAAVCVGEKIYSFGGYCTGENSLRWRPMDVHVLNTSNYRWSLLPVYEYTDKSEIPFQRYGHTAVTFACNIYIWGGRNDDIACNVLYCFNTKTYRWHVPTVSGNIPGPRDGHSACVIGNKMYIFGGFDEEAERFSQSVYALDFQTMTWKCLITNYPPPTHRDFHSASVFENRIYIFGGRGDMSGEYHTQEEVYCPDIMYLDLTSMEWHKPKTSGERPTGRRSHSAFLYDNYIYIFGGYNGLLNEHFNHLYRFCPRTNHWSLIHPGGIPPCPRRRQACIIVGDRMFLFGGTSPLTHEQGRFEPDDKLLDHDDLHVLEFKPTLHLLCLLAVIKYKLDQKCLPEILRWEIRCMVTPNCVSRQLNSTG